MKTSNALLIAASLWLLLVINCALPNKTVSGTPIAVSSSELLQDYESNEVAADNRYKGHLVTVTGRVDKIGKDIADTMYVTLAGKSQSSLFTVQCFFDDSWKGSLSQIRPGDVLSVTGTCDGKFGNVLIKDCNFH